MLKHILFLMVLLLKYYYMVDKVVNELMCSLKPQRSKKRALAIRYFPLGFGLKIVLMC